MIKMKGQAFLVGGAILIVGIIIVYSLSSGINVDILNAEIINTSPLILPIINTLSSTNNDALSGYAKFLIDGNNQWFVVYNETGNESLKLIKYSEGSFKTYNKTIPRISPAGSITILNRQTMNLNKNNNLIYIYYMVSDTLGNKEERYDIFNESSGLFLTARNTFGYSTGSDFSCGGNPSNLAYGLTQSIITNNEIETLLYSTVVGDGSTGGYSLFSINNSLQLTCKSFISLGGVASLNGYEWAKSGNNYYSIVRLKSTGIRLYNSTTGNSWTQQSIISNNVIDADGNRIRKGGIFFIDNNNFYFLTSTIDDNKAFFFMSNNSGNIWNNTLNSTYSDELGLGKKDDSLIIYLLNGTDLITYQSSNNGLTFSNSSIYLTNIESFNIDFTDNLMITYTNGTIKFGQYGFTTW